VSYPVAFDDLRVLEQQRGRVVVPKYRMPEPKITGMRSIRTSSINPARNACPARLPAATETSPSPANACA
jgi:hypothetical protein